MTRAFPELQEPSGLALIREIRTGFDIARGLAGTLAPMREAEALDIDVILLPGLGSSPRSMLPIKRALARAGVDAEDWGLGFNDGRVLYFLESMTQRLTERFSRTGRPVVLIGWSLGGYIARETARAVPRFVSQVVTMGSPVYGGPRYTTLARLYRARGIDIDQIERATIDRFQQPIQVPVTAIYSKNDGIVSWRACIDHWSPMVTHLETAASHFGMAFAPDVQAAVVAEVVAEARQAPESVQPAF